ncbi:Hypothetical predicted protein [Podarcis lilfordi]|uniref:Uncharacterized protein n=1 Tax=Podarcis lilfordi TaxID=74358 RepID=A0AA35PM00_9SAUR|nr:Hypothetical predicted protein [Podarcis lilfordi]
MARPSPAPRAFEADGLPALPLKGHGVDLGVLLCGGWHTESSAGRKTRPRFLQAVEKDGLKVGGGGDS